MASTEAPVCAFAGKKLTVSEPHRGVGREVESFVAVLGARSGPW
ncbi:MAG: hypothetical protein OXH96_18260 [Spirochaetaceae bacterium]|nr:hypothetical protein [Spirochaetaceae bacterium]